MRRRALSAFLAVAVLLAMPGTVVGVQAFDRACDGSLEGLRYLRNARAQFAAATAPPPPPQATPTAAASQAQAAPPRPTPVPPPAPPPPTVAQRLSEAVGVAGDAAFVVLIQIKQSDLVAYPAHIVAAHTLDAAGCGKDAVRLQWLKAGLHASTDPQIQRIAASLVASAHDPVDLADLRLVVRNWSERAPESVALRRVLAALEDHPM